MCGLSRIGGVLIKRVELKASQILSIATHRQSHERVATSLYDKVIQIGAQYGILMYQILCEATK